MAAILPCEERGLWTVDVRVGADACLSAVIRFFSPIPDAALRGTLSRTPLQVANCVPCGERLMIGE